MPAPAGLDLSWLTKFVRDQIQQNQLQPQAQAKVATHNVEDLVVNGSVDLSSLSTFQLQQLRAQLGIPKVTVSAMAGGPPTGASVGDIWIATNVEASSNTHWQFINFGTTNTYPWKFIGGPAVYTYYNGTIQNTVDNAWEVVANTPAFTLPRSGQYNYEFGGVFGGNNNVLQYMTVGTSAGGAYSPYFYSGNGQALTANSQWPMVGQNSDRGFSSRVAGDVLKMLLQSPSHTSVNVTFPWLTVTPIAIS